jgi:hypothetical protein
MIWAACLTTRSSPATETTVYPATSLLACAVMAGGHAGPVLAHLGLHDYTGPIPAPKTRRQSNDLNDAWVAAYLTDKAASQSR